MAQDAGRLGGGGEPGRQAQGGVLRVPGEPWHADVEGDEARRTHNLNLANWVPDLFMKRVEADLDWTCSKAMPHLTDLYGEAFDRA